MAALKIDVPEYFEERILRIKYLNESFHTSGVDSTLKDFDCFKNVLINGFRGSIIDQEEEILEFEVQMTNKVFPNVSFTITRQQLMKNKLFGNSILVKLQFEPKTKRCIAVTPMRFSEYSTQAFQETQFEQSRNK